MSQARSPTSRPTWLLALSSAMLLYGGLTLVGGLFTARDPKALATLALRAGAQASMPPEVMKKLAAIDEVILDRHRAGVRANALGGVAFGLYALYAVAAILSRDRHGRVLALGVAGLGIVYQLAGIPLAAAMSREEVVARTPVIAAAVADKGIGPAEIAKEIQSGFVRPAIVSLVVGIFWAGIIVVYFGGRRGRIVYGLEPERRPER